MSARNPFVPHVGTDAWMQEILRNAVTTISHPQPSRRRAHCPVCHGVHPRQVCHRSARELMLDI